MRGVRHIVQARLAGGLDRRRHKSDNAIAVEILLEPAVRPLQRPLAAMRAKRALER